MSRSIDRMAYKPKKKKRKKIVCPEAITQKILDKIMPIYENHFCGIKTRKATSKELKQGI